MLKLRDLLHHKNVFHLPLGSKLQTENTWRWSVSFLTLRIVTAHFRGFPCPSQSLCKTCWKDCEWRTKRCRVSVEVQVIGKAVGLRYGQTLKVQEADRQQSFIVCLINGGRKVGVLSFSALSRRKRIAKHGWNHGAKTWISHAAHVSYRCHQIWANDPYLFTLKLAKQNVFPCKIRKLVRLTSLA